MKDLRLTAVILALVFILSVSSAFGDDIPGERPGCLIFTPKGRLWTVSEAGTRRWLRWSMTYLFVFQVGVEKLKQRF